MSDLEPPQRPNPNEPGQDPRGEIVYVPKGWLWAIRGAALAVVVPGVASIGYMAVKGNPNTETFAIALVIFFLPYLTILGGLKGTPSRMILILAGLWGSLITLLLSLIAVPNLLAQSPASSEWWGFLGLFVLGGGAHAVMVVGAFIATRALPPEPGRIGRTLRALFLTGVFAVLVLMVISTLPGLLRSRMSTNEASAAGSMILLVTCAFNPLDLNPTRGFPHDATVMGPGADGCIDENLANAATPDGYPKSGYRFEYVAGAEDAEGMVTTFEIRGRPVEYGKSGERGYYADESGVIRVTKENRPATKDDPPI